MIFHVHYCYSENSGEIRRIKNINRDIVNALDNVVVEIVFISWKHFFTRNKYRFKLSDIVKRKFYFPNIPLSNRSSWMRKINSYYNSVILLILCLYYKPKYILGELSYRAQRLIPKSVTNLLDLHGALPEEYEYSAFSPNHSIVKYLNNLEKYGVLKSQSIICQSDAMKSHLLNKYINLPKNKIYVYRCAMDSSLFYKDDILRKNLRLDLGIANDEFLFVYSGGFHKWQRVTDALNYFVLYHQNNFRSKFLILTLDINTAMDYVENNYNEIKDAIIIKSVANHEVCGYLNASDVAFLLRDDVIMNAVAYPTKLSEYLACGVPVITTTVSKNWIDNQTFLFNIDLTEINQLDDFLKAQNRDLIAKYALDNLSLNIDKEQVQLLIKSSK